MDVTQDEKIAEAVEERLTSDERTKDMAIEVSSAAGEVTLRGQVDSQGMKEAAEQIARSVSGVMLVINELAVTTDQQRREENTIPRVPVVPATGPGGSGGYPMGTNRL